VRTIQEMPAPTDVAGVKRVLDLVQYLAKFIPNLSDVSDPLRILVKNDVQWHWNRLIQLKIHLSTPLEHLSDATVVLLVVFTPYKNIVDYTFYTR
jgi:hypothetical protein